MAKGYSARRGFSNGAGQAAQQMQMQQKLMQMQQEMAKAQQEVEEATFTASVGGGAVSAAANGKKEITALTIKPEAVDPEDVEMLQDLVISAVNEALRQEIISYFETCLTDTAKLRELLPDGTYTPLRQFVREGEQPFDSQEHLIKQAQMARTAAAQAEVARGANKATIAQVDQKEAAKAVEEKIAASQAAQAAPAPAPTPAAATDAASEQPAPTVTIQPASATSVPQRPHKGGLLSGVLGALFKKGPRR